MFDSGMVGVNRRSRSLQLPPDVPSDETRVVEPMPSKSTATAGPCAALITETTSPRNATADASPNSTSPSARAMTPRGAAGRRGPSVGTWNFMSRSFAKITDGPFGRDTTRSRS